jgi:hypothetical protein
MRRVALDATTGTMPLPEGAARHHPHGTERRNTGGGAGVREG